MLAPNSSLHGSSRLRAQARPYPSKPVTIIADAAAGSTPDVVLRLNRADIIAV
jgi:tripartite-type tricarboxylate transporter receptor subunit TctC